MENSWACSYPSDGEGKGNDWVATRMSSSCSYEGSHLSLDSCKRVISEKWDGASNGFYSLRSYLSTFLIWVLSMTDKCIGSV